MDRELKLCPSVEVRPSRVVTPNLLLVVAVDQPDNAFIKRVGDGALLDRSQWHALMAGQHSSVQTCGPVLPVGTATLLEM